MNARAAATTICAIVFCAILRGCATHDSVRAEATNPPTPPTAASAPVPHSLADLRAAAERPSASTADFIALGDRLVAGDGSGAGIDEANAAVWFTKAADRNDPLGKARLADLLLSGRGVVIDRPRALTLYREAAQAGLPEAQLSLGLALSQGLGTPGGVKDMKEAVRWWTAAAESGYAPAQFQMGVCKMRVMDGPPRDPAAAFRWFQRAADQGHVASQANVGRALLSGEGVGKDALKAYMWATLAFDGGADLSKRTLDAAAKELSEPQIAEAKRLAAEFRPRPEHPAPAR